MGGGVIMALSPSHKFGQIVGDVLEQALYPLLERFATTHGLYIYFGRFEIQKPVLLEPAYKCCTGNWQKGHGLQ